MTPCEGGDGVRRKSSGAWPLGSKTSGAKGDPTCNRKVRLITEERAKPEWPNGTCVTLELAAESISKLFLQRTSGVETLSPGTLAPYISKAQSPNHYAPRLNRRAYAKLLLGLYVCQRVLHSVETAPVAEPRNGRSG